MRIGILALQGAFIEHKHMLDRLGAESFEIRQPRDVKGGFDGLIIPGGESTVQGKLLRQLGLYESLKERIEGGMPVFGTCAGLIMLAKKISNDDNVYFGTMDITVKRNAYGRQLGSFFTESAFAGIGTVPMTFIRAPYIESVSGKAEALAAVDGNIVAAKEGNQLVTAFHPELNEDTSVHEYFLNMIKM